MYTLKAHLGYIAHLGIMPLEDADIKAREIVGSGCAVKCLASWQRNKECYRYHAWNGQKWVLVATVESVA